MGTGTCARSKELQSRSLVVADALAWRLSSRHLPGATVRGCTCLAVEQSALARWLKVTRMDVRGYGVDVRGYAWRLSRRHLPGATGTAYTTIMSTRPATSQLSIVCCMYVGATNCDRRPLQ
eukprot:5799573-Pyramimonas_sp.AAC.1